MINMTQKEWNEEVLILDSRLENLEKMLRGLANDVENECSLFIHSEGGIMDAMALAELLQRKAEKVKEIL